MISEEIRARFETDDKLSDEDRKAIIEIARETLASFQPKRDAEPEAKSDGGELERFKKSYSRKRQTSRGRPLG